jgi:phosphoenolpyruvate-protein phosphotransferase (PTS system enzyme I)
MDEQRLVGKSASTGAAAGPVEVLSHAVVAVRAAGDRDAEATALRAAIAVAIEQLSLLAVQAKGDGADIIAFQIAMLEDEALAESAFGEIAAGVSADQAWRHALERAISDYESAADESFRARATDLSDICARVLAALTGVETDAPLPEGAIVVGEDLTPSRFLSTDWSRGGGIVLTRGSASSHVATLARSRGVPMIVGAPLDLRNVASGTQALLDGENATLWLNPAPSTVRAFAGRERSNAIVRLENEERRLSPAVTSDGTAIAVYANISDLAEIDSLDITGFDGVGLVRTEFLFGRSANLPDEEEQYVAYRRLAEWAHGKPVTIRTLDAGADKPIAGLSLAQESNPFLGLRGVRLSLAHPDVFRVQLRALCRAAAHGGIEVMLPMVSVPAEMQLARTYLREEARALSAAGVAHREPGLGMMVEVPAAAIAIARFDADFFSIGSNDLTQYVMAAARDNSAVAELNDPMDPAVLRLVTQVVAHAAAARRKASLCGDAGGEPKYVESLLRAGLRALSITPAALGRVKAAIAKVDLSRSEP